MSLKIIKEINQFSCFRFNEELNIVENIQSSDNLDIDALLKITHMLDENNISYFMGRNFNIKLLK